MPEIDVRKERANLGVREGECGLTDGISLCTEPAGHGPTHWDRYMQHEWSDKEDD